MSEINKKIVLAEDKLVVEMGLRQLSFKYSFYHPFTKNKKTQKNWETGDSRYICQNKLEKPCLQHNVAYRAFRYLPKRTASDKVLYDEAFILLPWFIIFLINGLLIQTKKYDLILM